MIVSCTTLVEQARNSPQSSQIVHCFDVFIPSKFSRTVPIWHCMKQTIREKKEKKKEKKRNEKQNAKAKEKDLQKKTLGQDQLSFIRTLDP